MEGVSFTANRIRVSPGVDREPVATVDALVVAADALALAQALAWQRSRQFLAPAAETAADVLALRELVTVVDAVEHVSAGGPLHLTQAQVLLLTEAAAMYVAERDHDEYMEPAERERIARLRTLSDRLMGIAADLADALAHAAPTRG